MARRRNLPTTPTVTWFLNHGPDAAHFAWNIQRFKKLRDAKNAASDLGTDRWALIRAEDLPYEGLGRAVALAGCPAYHEAAERFCQTVNASAGDTP